MPVDSSSFQMCRVVFRNRHRNAAIGCPHIQRLAIPTIATQLDMQAAIRRATPHSSADAAQMNTAIQRTKLELAFYVGN
jgi:hypothetical protein